MRWLGRLRGWSYLPKGKRPFRIYVDPSDDGAEDVFRVGDRVRQWFFQRIGYSDLLNVSS